MQAEKKRGAGLRAGRHAPHVVHRVVGDQIGQVAVAGMFLLGPFVWLVHRSCTPLDEQWVDRAGQSVSVTLDALDRAVQARVGEIVPAVDAASRSYTVKIDLPAVPQLRSGMFGRAVFTLGKRRCWLSRPAPSRSAANCTRCWWPKAGGTRTPGHLG